MDHVFIICFIFTHYTSIILIYIQTSVVITMELNNDDFKSYFTTICDYGLLIHSIVICLSNISLESLTCDIIQWIRQYFNDLKDKF